MSEIRDKAKVRDRTQGHSNIYQLQEEQSTRESEKEYLLNYQGRRKTRQN